MNLEGESRRQQIQPVLHTSIYSTSHCGGHGVRRVYNICRGYGVRVRQISDERSREIERRNLG